MKRIKYNDRLVSVWYSKNKNEDKCVHKMMIRKKFRENEYFVIARLI